MILLACVLEKFSWNIFELVFGVVLFFLNWNPCQCVDYFRTYLEYTFLVERVEPLTLQRFRTTANLHGNFGPLHVIYFCSHSLLLRLRKLPLPRVFDCNREGFCSSTKRKERIWIWNGGSLHQVGWWHVALDMFSVGQSFCIMDFMIDAKL